MWAIPFWDIKAHMGAGSITSNVKSDKKLITIKGAGYAISIPESKKSVHFLGDGVEVGCGSVLKSGYDCWQKQQHLPAFECAWLCTGRFKKKHCIRIMTEIVEKNAIKHID